jgi:drug/metabolite transporter (DMT)-like permease
VSQFWVGNICLGLSIMVGATAQVVLKHIMNIVGPSLNWRSPSTLITHAVSPLGLLAVSLLVASFLLWLASLSRLDLGYAYPIACASALVVALFGVFFLGESLTVRMGIGIVLIVAGTALLVPAH